MNNFVVKEVFSDAFHSYKAFENLDPEVAGDCSMDFPKTIWQILNHLVVWQAYQLAQLKGLKSAKAVMEAESWIRELKPENPAALAEAVSTFHQQIEEFKVMVINFMLPNTKMTSEVKILQDISVHLSFHIGEVVLMRRILKNYPLAHEMEEFLRESKA